LVVIADGEYSADVTHNIGYRAGYAGTGEVPYTKLDIEVVHVLRWRDGKVVAGKGAIFNDGTSQYDQFWSHIEGETQIWPNGRSSPDTVSAPSPNAPTASPALAVV